MNGLVAIFEKRLLTLILTVVLALFEYDFVSDIHCFLQLPTHFTSMAPP